MSLSDGQDLAHYYKQELAYLRAQGADFAQRYPKVASRLALHGAESQDPHTERLIESFAFLAARVHRDMEQELPATALGVLDKLCPSLVQPIPSITVAQFLLDPSQGKVTAGFEIEQGTSLYAKTAQSQECRFSTAWATTLWPLQIAHASLDGDAVLRLELECNSEADFSELEIDRLCIHLHGDLPTSMALYDVLTAGLKSVAVQVPQEPAQLLPMSAWKELGFDAKHLVLPVPDHVQPAFVLLQEYFAFPRKFHFFELNGLKGKLGRGRRCELIFQLDRPAYALRKISAQNFALGCVPIVNLFPRISEPVVLDQRHYEYLLTADRQRDSYTQVHSILKVTASDPTQDKPQELMPFGAYAGTPVDEHIAYWSARRQASLRPNIAGTDVFLSFVDRHCAQSLPASTVVYAHLLCTNRRLAEQVPVSAKLIAEGAAQPTRTRLLYEPSMECDPPMGSDALWKLNSLLALNHLSLINGKDGLLRLRELLNLFASDSRRDHAQIKGIASLAAHSTTAHIGQQSWRGFCRGTQINLEFDEESYVGGSSLLMSAVLAHFFAMYTAMNSFVQVAAMRSGEVRRQWKPMSGHQLVL